MSWIPRSDAVQATLLTSVGALILFGAWSLPAPLLAITMLVIAILVLAHTLRAPMWLGATLLVLALLMLVRNPVGRFLDDALQASLPVIAGGLLMALGLLKLSKADVAEAPTTV